MIIASISTTPMMLGKCFMVLSLFFAIPLNFFASRQVFFKAFKLKETQFNHVIVSLIMATSSCLIAILFETVNIYFGLMGGTAGVLMSGGIPALCYAKKIKLRKRDYASLLICLFVSLFAMIGGILSVVDPV
eukprot:GHVR01085887.1.p1 GENE.GHVR01085887.1~~GHVR01085887.1.p1  ORF type:complete len:132 (+),score=6.03 GHVR01085887.1:2026-2421(+)